MRVAVIGLGKLGCPMAGVLSAAGHYVYGVDEMPGVHADIDSGRHLIAEPGMTELFNTHPFEHGATIPAETPFDAYVVIVPTPSTDDGSFEPYHVRKAVTAIAEHLSGEPGTPVQREKHDPPHPLVVIMSTVSPGTTDGLASILRGVPGRTVGENLHLVYSPAFIALGSVIRDLRHPEFILCGCGDDGVGAYEYALLSSSIAPGTPAATLGYREAEIAKLAVNAYVTMKITFANTLAVATHRWPEVSARRITEAIGMDSRIGHRYLSPGLPFGGDCFPRDNRALAAGLPDWDCELAKTVDTQNADLAEWMFDAIVMEAEAQNIERIGVDGLTFKPGTKSCTESFGVDLARHLAAEGFTVTASDPLLTSNEILAVLDGRVVLEMEPDMWVLCHPGPRTQPLPAGVLVDPWHICPDGDDVVHLW